MAYGDLDLASFERPAGAYRLTKRIFDVGCAAGLLLVSLPLLVAIALAIKLTSPGPVVLRQRRIGHQGRDLYILKFRSMIQDRRRGDSGIMPPLVDRRQRHKTPHDPRITGIGRSSVARPWTSSRSSGTSCAAR